MEQSSNDRRAKMSFNPMRFGSENDLEIALTELTWTMKIKGRLTNSDFMTAAEKYKFPIDFLKRGLEGYSYPEDWLISKSKWFPVIYSWVVRDKEYSLNLFKLQFDYLRTGFNSICFFTILIVIFLQVGFALPVFLHLDFIQIVSVVILPFTLSLIALYVELANNIGDKRAKLEEYLVHLKDIGLEYIIARNEQYIEQNYRAIIFAGNIIFRKMQSATTVQLFEIGTKEIQKQQPRSKRLLKRLHLLPKSFASTEIERIPVFYGENVHLEYTKRMKELVRDIE